jgi:two-component system cell cycle response regulator DivK
MQARTFTILLVEDHEDIRSATRTRLCHAGYDVLEAADGQQGVELARAEVPDLIFMDLELPILNGFEAIQQIRADESCCGVPIIAVSNHCWHFDWKDKALALGCAECLDKGKLISAFDDLLQRYVT